jgi:MoaA/NifB/PqqE/SkfB family radical SAM enzyme
MCNIWQFPTKRQEEFSPEILEKLPDGMTRLNITGGEPFLRDDLLDIVKILDKKTKRLEISTNGYFTERIVEVCQKFPTITIRVSIEGLPRLNDDLRGLKDGFDHALHTILRLKNMGMRDIGFATVISDRNCADLLHIYDLCTALDIEFANATMHNSFYFHKYDNEIKDISTVSEQMRLFIEALLSSKRSNIRRRVKDWGRAYLNYGLLRYMMHTARPLPCSAAMDTVFVSPRGELLACNGSEEPWVMGDLKAQAFDEIWNSHDSEMVRNQVKNCSRNCWMTGTAVPAMRRNLTEPLVWVLKNKARVALGQELSLK